MKEVLQSFATREYPIRASNLPNFFMCSGWLLAEIMTENERDPWKATHTGTGFGIAAEIYHRDYDSEVMTQDDVKELMSRLTELSTKGGSLIKSDGTENIIDPFPLADLEQIEKWIDFYTQDPRNRKGSEFGEVLKDSLELSLAIELPPHEEDPTGLPIFITGHTDQVRRNPYDGVLEVWDIKCSKRFKDHREDMILHYATQQAIYVHGVWQHYREPTRWGGVIHPPSYSSNKRVPNPGTDKKKKGKTILVPRKPHECDVFIKAYYPDLAIQAILDQVRLRVALVRAGKIQLSSGGHCKWCVYEGFHNCFGNFQV